MRGKKRWFLVLSMMMGLYLMSVGVLANEQTGTMVEGSVLTMDTSAECQVALVEGATIEFGTPAITTDPVLPIIDSEQKVIGSASGITPYGYYLAEGGCGISRMQDNIARVEGYTNCFREAEYVYVGMYMDRLEDGYWHTVWYKEFSAEDCYRVSYAINVLVKPGYYYRVRAAHLAQTGDVREANTSFTNGVAFGL